MPINMAKTHVGVAASGSDCIDDYELFRYYTKAVTEAEAERIEQHLVACEICCGILVTLAKDASTPMSDADKVELTQVVTSNPGVQVDKILMHVADDQKRITPSPPRPPAPKQPWKGVPLELLKDVSRHPIRYVSLASIILAVIIGRPIYNSRQSDALTNSGLSYLAANYQIDSRDVPRPKGGFAYNVFGGPTRSRDENRLARFEPVKNDFQRALHLNAKNAAAHQYLGTYYLLIERDLRQAQEQYRRALAQDTTNAAIINDLGVLAFYQGAFAEAAERFVRALKYDPRMLEAQYNLAIIYQMQGKREEAIQELAKYLQQDSTLTWAEVVKNRLKLLRQDRP